MIAYVAMGAEEGGSGPTHRDDLKIREWAVNADPCWRLLCYRGGVFDVGIIGAGPAGLACAIGLRQRGLSVIVYEKGIGPRDKACGEGLMPPGLAALQRLGVRIPQSHPIVGIRYVNESGYSVAASLAQPGLGVRRLTLSRALRARAEEVGVVLKEGATVSRTDARFTIGAYGLQHVPVDEGPRRFGMRQHFAVKPWTDHVEVYFSEHVEAYVTPVGPNEIGVAFLWDEDRFDASVGHAALCKLFPFTLGEPTSSVRGLGPLARRPIEIIDRDFALVGDAAGYADAITGEGLSLAFETAEVLVEEIVRKRSGYMSDYARFHNTRFNRYALLANSLVQLSARPWLRRLVVRALPAKVFEKILAFTVGEAHV